MKSRISRLLLAVVGILCLIAAGCFGGGPTLGSVTGKVTLDGNPLEGAIVEFEPEQGRPSSATTDSEGKYELNFTFQEKGALVGKHTVRIFPQTEDEDGNELPPAAIVQIPAKYNEQSGLTAEVERGSNTCDFELLSK
jgi:hypothetical protein